MDFCLRIKSRSSQVVVTFVVFLMRRPCPEAKDCSLSVGGYVSIPTATGVAEFQKSKLFESF